MAKTETKPNSSTKKKKSKRMKSLLSTRPASNRREQRDNPFETIWSRRKFDVLGKKRKGEERRIGLSRSIAIQKREKTLLKEFQQSNKSSIFDDKRIGENDESLEEFDKSLMRYQKVKISKERKKNKFNLSDEEGEEKDDFDEFLPPDEDEGNEELLNNSDMKYNNISEGNEQPYKTNKQAYSEVIQKSKDHKAQKAMEKEEDGLLMEKLDEEFASLAQKDALRALTQPNKINSLNSLLIKNNVIPDKEKMIVSKADISLIKEKPDTYDKLVKEMIMDSRARPSDRLKTPEEIAREERERLEQLEEERQKRMLAPEDSSDSDDSDNDNNNNNIKLSKKIQSTSGDDLGDSFQLDDDQTNKYINNNNINNNNNDSDNNDNNDSDDYEDDDSDDNNNNNNDSDENENENDLITKDWEQSDDEEEEINKVKKYAKNNKKNEMIISNNNNNKDKDKLEGLPFVIEAPNNLTDLCSLLDHRSDKEILEAVNRIRACNNIRLGVDNRKKMQVFYGLLLQYFALLATQRPIKMNTINLLVKPLIEMSNETPYFAAICARERLIRIRTRFCDDIKIQGKCGWPGLKTVVLFRLWILKFPCTDFRHVVMTPLLLLIGEFLMRCRVESARDLGVGSFLCSLLLSAIKQSKKYCSEAIIFLQTILLSSLTLNQQSQLPSQLIQLAEFREVKPWLCFDNKDCEVNRINLLSIIEIESDSPFFSSDEFKSGVLLSASEALMGFIQIYEDLTSFPEIFNSISVLLHTILEKNELPNILRANLQNCLDFIKRKTTEHNERRLPLQMHKKKPEPIKLLNPKFEENFVKGVDYDPDRERVQHKRLLKKIKSEEKGSIRELRKDKDFLLQVKDKKRKEEEAERAEKHGKNWAFLQEQQHAFKSGQLGKGKKRRK